MRYCCLAVSTFFEYRPWIWIRTVFFFLSFSLFLSFCLLSVLCLVYFVAGVGQGPWNFDERSSFFFFSCWIDGIETLSQSHQRILFSFSPLELFLFPLWHEYWYFIASERNLSLFSLRYMKKKKLTSCLTFIQQLIRTRSYMRENDLMALTIEWRLSLNLYFDFQWQCAVAWRSDFCTARLGAILSIWYKCLDEINRIDCQIRMSPTMFCCHSLCKLCGEHQEASPTNIIINQPFPHYLLLILLNILDGLLIAATPATCCCTTHEYMETCTIERTCAIPNIVLHFQIIIRRRAHPKSQNMKKKKIVGFLYSNSFLWMNVSACVCFWVAKINISRTERQMWPNSKVPEWSNERRGTREWGGWQGWLIVACMLLLQDNYNSTFCRQKKKQNSNVQICTIRQ